MASCWLAAAAACKEEIPGSCWKDCCDCGADACVDVELGREIGSSIAGSGARAAEVDVDAGLEIGSMLIGDGDGAGAGAGAEPGSGMA